MQCYKSPYKVDCVITTKERKIFDFLQSNSTESAGAMIFNQKGKLSKFNVFLGGTLNKTWGHNHIVMWHTHPSKNNRKFSPPSHTDLRNFIIGIYNNISGVQRKILYSSAGLVFSDEGCWIFRCNDNLIKIIEKYRNKNNKSMKLFLDKLTKKIVEYSIGFAQLKYHRGKDAKKLSYSQYIDNMNKIGFKIKLVRRKKPIKICNVYQCIETATSKTKIYNIPADIELNMTAI